MRPSQGALLSFLGLAASVATIPTRRQVQTNQTSLGQPQVTLIKALLDRTANESWERGTHLQALTEYDFPTLSVFSPSYDPPPRTPIATPVLAFTSFLVSTKAPDALPLMPDGSAADPAAVGVAVTLANFTSTSGNVSAAEFGEAARDQVRFLLEVAPRTRDGAISHRVEQVQLWSDFVYMVPPFLAYYGVLNKNTTIIQAAYDQCRLYRQYLRNSNGLWTHIVMGTNPDRGLWASGNAWAAGGMMRVIASIVHSDYASEFMSQTDDLTAWTTEIVQASFAQQRSDGFFSNYFNRNSFSDASSAALMAAVSYRLAQLNLGSSTLAAAQRTRLAIYSSLSPTTAILTPVVNPLSYSNEGTYSPEGQAFVLLMEAAWRDWVLAGSKESDTKASGVTVAKSRGRRGEVQGWASLVGLALGGWLLF